MSVASVIAAGRVAAEARMLDSCRITRIVGKTFNDDNGQYEDDVLQVYPADDTLDAGRCEFSGLGGASGVTDPVAGGYEFTLQDCTLKLPVVGSEGVHLDDTVTCVSAAFDAELVGRTWTVKALFHRSQATSRRLVITEVAG